MQVLEFNVAKRHAAATLKFAKEFCDANRIPLLDYRRGIIDHTYDRDSTVWVEVVVHEQKVWDAVTKFIAETEAADADTH